MRHFKTFAIALAIMVCGNTFAGSTMNPDTPVTKEAAELTKLLNGDYLQLSKSQQGKIIFYLNENKEIVIHSVLCRDSDLRKQLQKKLENQKLTGEGWVTGKVYILPVKMKMVS